MILLAFMAPMITAIIGDVIGEYSSPVGLVMFLVLPVLGIGVLLKLVFS